MVKLLIFFSFIISGVCLASGAGEHHASPLDLIFPFINVGILGGVLFWKLAPVFKAHFLTKHKSIKANAERAKTLKFEAQMKFEQQEKKNQTLEKTINEIKIHAIKEIDQYKDEKSKENSIKILKLKQDANSKIEMQKQEYISALNNELVTLIIDKAKKAVETEGGLKSTIETKLMQGLK